MEMWSGYSVVVLCHPIKNVNDPAQLLPRGGGAFLAEMDGNLTVWKRDDDTVELHHTKIRGPTDIQARKDHVDQARRYEGQARPDRKGSGDLRG
jgi:hypothetical protein